MVTALLAGCGGGDQTQVVANVKGRVTLDGKPLVTGEIKFTAEGSGDVPILLPITNGVYEGQVPVGKNLIEIYSFSKAAILPQDTPGADAPSYENIIPARYNTESTTAQNVTEAGPNELNFELTSR